MADLRAPTPSAAAELAVANIDEVRENLNKYNLRMKIALKKKTELMRLHLEKVLNSRAFKNPLQRVQDEYVKLDSIIKNIQNSINKKYLESKNLYLNNIARLDSLSPLKTLSRGYSIIQKQGKIINSKTDLKTGDSIDIRLIDGNKTATID